MNLSKYFSLAELTRSAGHPQIPNQPGAAELAAMQALCQRVLDPLREAVAAPVGVSSGYRGPALNRKVGGVANSQHCTGQAADLQSPAVSALALFKAVIRLGLPFDQAIYEDKSPSSRWLHVSHNAAGNRGQLLVATFRDGRARYASVTAAQALAMPESQTRGLRGPSDSTGFEELHDEPPPSVSAPAVLHSASPRLRRARSAAANSPQTTAAADTAPNPPTAVKPKPRKPAATAKAAATKPHCR